MDVLDALRRALTVDVFATLILLVSLIVVRAIAARAVRSRTAAAPHDQRRYLANIRTVLFLVGLLGLVMIWAPQLRTFALSLTAVAVAIVVATKELILCLSGSVLRASSRAFSVGDWIEIGDIRGEVIDHDLLVTKLQEFADPPAAFSPTGRIVAVPNSMLLTTPVRNRSALRGYTYHRFALTFEPTAGVFERREEIMDVLRRHYSPLREQAARFNAGAERRTGADLPDPEPAARFTTSDLGKHRVEIVVFVPITEAESLENEISAEIVSMLGRSRDPVREEGSAETVETVKTGAG